MRKYGLFVKTRPHMRARVKNGSGAVAVCSVLPPRYPWIEDCIPELGQWAHGAKLLSVWQTRVEYNRVYPDMAYVLPVARRVFQSLLIASVFTPRPLTLRPVKEDQPQ